MSEHAHGMSEAAVLGGASGAIEIEGIANLQPAVVGLPQRYLMIRDQIVPGAVFVNEPGWDISLNYVPIDYTAYQPSVIQIKPGAKEFWRVVNADADTIMDLVLAYDQKVQSLQLVALDGVPLGSQNGTQQGKTQTVDHILIPPAGRAEFIITGPAASVASAYLATRKIQTGQAGDNDPARPLAVLHVSNQAAALPVLRATAQPVSAPRFPDLATAAVTGNRLLYFSEDFTDVSNPPGLKKRLQPESENFFFYITVEGQTPTLFNPANPPAITTHVGAVEDWVVQNQTLENHEFHIHQIHFLLLQRNRKTLPLAQQTMLDTVNVPAWSGEGPYPSVTLRMDFRGQMAGDFVYHCHILGHEDHGMMAIIRVLPKA